MACAHRPLLRPADAAQIAEIIRFAATEKLAVIPCGGCTKLGIGSPPSRYDIALDLTRMNRVLAYDPRDLTLGVEPGVRIEDLLQCLAEQKQFLPLAVPFSDRATIGGIVAANSSSPLRHSYGGVRDFCLGMEFVTGEGSRRQKRRARGEKCDGLRPAQTADRFAGNARRHYAREFPHVSLPSAQGTFVASFSDAEAAFGFCREIAQSVLTPQMVEVADPGAAHFIFAAETPERITAQQWSVMVTAAGQPAVVDRHARELGHMAAGANADEFVRLSDAEQSSILARIREFPRLVLEAAPSAMIFRIGVVAHCDGAAARAAQRIGCARPLDFAALTRASGVVYAALLAERGRDRSLRQTRKACHAKYFRLAAIPKLAPTRCWSGVQPK